MARVKSGGASLEAFVEIELESELAEPFRLPVHSFEIHLAVTVALKELTIVVSEESKSLVQP